MRARTRKLIGAVALIALVFVWALAVMVLAQVPDINANRAAQLIFYALGGLGWVLPAMPLVRWMGRPDPPAL